MNQRYSATAAMLALVLVISASPASGIDLFDLAPGSPRPQVEALLKDAGLRYRSLDASGFEVRASLLAGIFELQRGVFEFGEGGRLDTATVEITPAMNSDGLDILELYEEVATLLLRRLGSPTRERSTGTIQSPGQILVGLSTGEVQRMMEWETESFVRLGIPRRVDGRILVVVAVRGRAFPENDPFWGPR
jgi:hypothetical protein